MTEEPTPGPHAEQEQGLREQIKTRWGQNVIVRGFTRKADGTLLHVQLQDPHVPRSDNAQASSVSWDPRTDLLLGDQKACELFEWFEQQTARTAKE
jgi:hypothetical protein